VLARTGICHASSKEFIMKIRPSTLSACLATAALIPSLTTSIAFADVGFPGAVILCREAVPSSTLLSIETRIRNGVWVYEGDLFDVTATLKSTPRLNAATGALIRLDIDAADADETAAAQAILSRLGDAQLDFADAIGFANGASNQVDVERVKFEIEAGILAFRVEYMDGATFDIDSATGGVIPHHAAGDDIEETLPSTVVLPAIAAAESNAGGVWTTIGLETEFEANGNIVEVLMLNPKSGLLGQATVSGETVTSFVEFAPAGNQAARVAEVVGMLGSIALDASGAVAAAEGAYPGAGIHEVELEIETEKSGTTAFWKISLVTVDLIEIDYFVDATVAGGNGLRFATAPVNFVAGDFNRDRVVNAVDLADLLSTFGAVNPPMDLNGSGTVDAADLAAVLSNWTQN
jgi:uncharacterized membrane protein YkoI